MGSAGIPSETVRAVSRRSVFRRRLIASVWATSLLLQQGCYNSVPVVGASMIPAGEVTITVNDRGRTMLGSRLGTLLDNLTGRIVRADSTQVEIAVSTATDVRGTMARWGGERFVIPREGIGTMVEKKVAKKRSWMLAGAIVAGLAVILITIKSVGKGDRNPDPDPNPI
jgi:hypothetical protein